MFHGAIEAKRNSKSKRRTQLIKKSLIGGSQVNIHPLTKENTRFGRVKALIIEGNPRKHKKE